MQNTADLWEVLCRDFQAQRTQSPPANHGEVAEQFLNSARQVLRPESRRLSDAYEIAADLCHAGEDDARAMKFYQQALDVSVRSSLPENSARIAGKLAILREESGEITEALMLFEQAIDLFDQADDYRQHPALLSHCASLQRRLGDQLEARRHYEEAIRMGGRLHGETHPEVAVLLNNFGVALCEWKLFNEAETCHLRALQICESAFGSTHPDVGQSMGNLAVLYHVQREFARATRFYQAALQVLERTRDSHDPEVLALKANFEALKKSSLRAR